MNFFKFKSIIVSFNSSFQIPVVKKKLNGYVGFANLPNQVHRKSVKKGFQFTLMVVGKFEKDYRIVSFQIHLHLLCLIEFLNPLSLTEKLMENKLTFWVFIGESGLGKSTLVNTLFNTSLYPNKEDKDPTNETPKTIDIQTISAGMYLRILIITFTCWKKIQENIFIYHSVIFLVMIPLFLGVI